MKMTSLLSIKQRSWQRLPYKGGLVLALVLVLMGSATGDQHWDHHGGIVGALPKVCRRVDKPAAALVADLKRLGLLDTTLVHWGGEIGRLPVIQN